MRLALCLGVCLLARAAASADVPADQCLGGTLLSAQASSITTKFNQKIITMPIAPGAEIWRRGVDLPSAQQLVRGDSIYLRCTQATGGTVMASLIAAVEDDDGVRMVPHHIVEIRVCGGKLIAVTKGALSVKNDQGVCVMHISANTTIWRGEIFHDTSALKLGDEITARVAVEFPRGALMAEDVEANADHWEGRITKILKNTVYIRFDAPIRGTGSVIFDRRTEFSSCAFDNDLKHNCTFADLKVGRRLDTIGLVLGKSELRATSVLGIYKH